MGVSRALGFVLFFAGAHAAPTDSDPADACSFIQVEGDLMLDSNVLPNRHPDTFILIANASATPEDMRRGGVAQILDSSSSFDKILAQIRQVPEQIYRISMDLPYDNVWQEMITFPQRRPRTFNVILATFKTWVADALVQLGEKAAARRAGRACPFDWQRSSSFALFGFLYIGVLQWLFYVSLFTVLCPAAARFSNEPWAEKIVDYEGKVDLFKQVGIDNFMLEPFIYFPLLYVLKDLMRYGLKDVAGTTNAALQRFWGNIYTDVLFCWAVWIPADFAIFACPMWMRLPLDHAVSFGWTMFISWLRGGVDKAPDDAVLSPRGKAKIMH